MLGRGQKGTSAEQYGFATTLAITSMQRQAVARPDQLDAIIAVTDAFATGAGRVQVIVASGTGKTLLGLWITERLSARLTIYFAPSLALLRQTVISWFSNGEPDVRIDAIGVCSDQTVSDDIPRSDVPISVTTDADVLASFMRGEHHATRRRIVFATYQSVAVVAEAFRATGVAPDLVVCDEAHRIAGREGKRFQAVLDAGRIPGSRRLFMTATPRIVLPHGRDLRDGEVSVASMDDVALFGKVAYSLPFGRAIALGLLAGYTIDVLAVGDADVEHLLALPSHPVTAKTPNELRLLAQAAATVNAFEAGTFRHVFSFHHTKAAATRFASAIAQSASTSGAREYCVGTVFGTTPVSEREAALSGMLNAPAGLLASARALMEGIDAPSLDAVLFVDPKRSVVDIAQGIGRALRRDPNNSAKTAHIVVPVIVSDEANEAAVDTELGSSAWAPVWQVLSAMAAHDDRLARALQLANHARGARDESSTILPRESITPSTGESLSLPISVVLPEGIPIERFQRALAVRAVESVGDPFDYGMGQLMAFVEHEGHAHPSHSHVTENGFRLGEWVGSQRTAFHRARLADLRARSLARLPGWQWRGRSDDFSEGYGILRRYMRKHGTARVPAVYWTSRGYWLSEWIHTQRALYHQGRLARPRVAALEALTGWSWNGRGPMRAPTTEALIAATDAAILDALSDFAHACPEPRPTLTQPMADDEYTYDYRRQPVHPIIDWLARDYCPALLRVIGLPGEGDYLADLSALSTRDDVSGRPYQLDGVRERLEGLLDREMQKHHAVLCWSSLHYADHSVRASDAPIAIAARLGTWRASWDEFALTGCGNHISVVCHEIATLAALIYAVRKAAAETRLDLRALALQRLACDVRHGRGHGKLSGYERMERVIDRHLSDPKARLRRLGVTSKSDVSTMLRSTIDAQNIAAAIRVATRAQSHVSGGDHWRYTNPLSAKNMADRAREARVSFGDAEPVIRPTVANRADFRHRAEVWRKALLDDLHDRIHGIRGLRNKHIDASVQPRWLKVEAVDGIPVGRAFRLGLERDDSHWGLYVDKRAVRSAMLWCPIHATFAMDRARSIKSLRGTAIIAARRSAPERDPAMRQTYHAVWLRAVDNETIALESGVLETESDVAVLLTCDTIGGPGPGRRKKPTYGDVHYLETRVDWNEPATLPWRFWAQTTAPGEGVDLRAQRHNAVSPTISNASHYAAMLDGTIVHSRDERFAFNLEAARAFAEREGHLLPRKEERPNGVNLYMWLKNQELRIRQGTMEVARRLALEDIPAWNARQLGTQVCED